MKTCVFLRTETTAVGGGTNRIRDFLSKPIKEKQRELDGKCSQCDTQIEKMERKRKGLEKCMDKEKSKIKAENAAILEDIERLNKALRSNIKATEDLARYIFPGRVGS